MGRTIHKISSRFFAAIMLAAMVAGIFVAFSTESGAAEKTIRLEYPDFDGKTFLL